MDGHNLLLWSPEFNLKVLANGLIFHSLLPLEATLGLRLDNYLVYLGRNYIYWTISPFQEKNECSIYFILKMIEKQSILLFSIFFTDCRYIIF